MKITRLSLDNVRAFEEAEFTFNPGFNLIIGIPVYLELARRLTS